MAGVLIANNRIPEAQALANDLLARFGPTPQVTAVKTLSDALDGVTPETTSPGSAEARLWSAIAALGRGDAAGAVPLAELQTALEALPETLRLELALRAVALLVEERRFSPGHDLMRFVEDWTAEPERMDILDYWRGRELELKGEREAARTVYAGLTDRSGEIGIRARYGLASLNLADADPAQASAIADELGYLATVWVLPELDRRHESLLAEALRKSGRLVDALARFDQRTAPNTLTAETMAAEKAALVEALVHESMPLSPAQRLAALSMLDRWADDSDAGKEQIRRAAKALAEAGLQARADAMLAAIQAKSAPIQAVEIGLDRARLQLEVGLPQDALEQLRSMARAVPPGTPLRRDWALLSAAALTRLGEAPTALKLLHAEQAIDNSPASRSVLAETAMAAGNWEIVATQLRQDLGPAPKPGDAPPSAEQLESVLGVIAAELSAGHRDRAETLAGEWGPSFNGRPEAKILGYLLRGDAVAMKRSDAEGRAGIQMASDAGRDD
jgi:hypothetical protein